MPAAGLDNRNIVVNSAMQSSFSRSFLCSGREHQARAHTSIMKKCKVLRVFKLNIKAEIYNWQNKVTGGEENVVNEIHQHILSIRKGYGSRAEKAEQWVSVFGGSTNENRALNGSTGWRVRKQEDQFREHEKLEGKITEELINIKSSHKVK